MKTMKTKSAHGLKRPMNGREILRFLNRKYYFSVTTLVARTK
jgi:hypothetical protein